MRLSLFLLHFLSLVAREESKFCFRVLCLSRSGMSDIDSDDDQPAKGASTGKRSATRPERVRLHVTEHIPSKLSTEVVYKKYRARIGDEGVEALGRIDADANSAVELTAVEDDISNDELQLVFVASDGSTCETTIDLILVKPDMQQTITLGGRNGSVLLRWSASVSNAVDAKASENTSKQPAELTTAKTAPSPVEPPSIVSAQPASSVVVAAAQPASSVVVAASPVPSSRTSIGLQNVSSDASNRGAELTAIQRKDLNAEVGADVTKRPAVQSTQALVEILPTSSSATAQSETLSESSKPKVPAAGAQAAAAIGSTVATPVATASAPVSSATTKPAKLGTAAPIVAPSNGVTINAKDVTSLVDGFKPLYAVTSLTLTALELSLLPTAGSVAIDSYTVVTGVLRTGERELHRSDVATKKQTSLVCMNLQVTVPIDGSCSGIKIATFEKRLMSDRLLGTVVMSLTDIIPSTSIVTGGTASRRIQRAFTGDNSKTTTTITCDFLIVAPQSPAPPERGNPTAVPAVLEVLLSHAILIDRASRLPKARTWSSLSSLRDENPQNAAAADRKDATTVDDVDPTDATVSCFVSAKTPATHRVRTIICGLRRSEVVTVTASANATISFLVELGGDTGDGLGWIAEDVVLPLCSDAAIQREKAPQHETVFQHSVFRLVDKQVESKDVQTSVGASARLLATSGYVVVKWRILLDQAQVSTSNAQVNVIARQITLLHATICGACRCDGQAIQCVWGDYAATAGGPERPRPLVLSTVGDVSFDFPDDSSVIVSGDGFNTLPTLVMSPTALRGNLNRPITRSGRVVAKDFFQLNFGVALTAAVLAETIVRTDNGNRTFKLYLLPDLSMNVAVNAGWAPLAYPIVAVSVVVRDFTHPSPAALVVRTRFSSFRQGTAVQLVANDAAIALLSASRDTRHICILDGSAVLRLKCRCNEGDVAAVLPVTLQDLVELGCAAYWQFDWGFLAVDVPATVGAVGTSSPEQVLERARRDDGWCALLEAVDERRRTTFCRGADWEWPRHAKRMLLCGSTQAGECRTHLFVRAHMDSAMGAAVVSEEVTLDGIEKAGRTQLTRAGVLVHWTHGTAGVDIAEERQRRRRELEPPSGFPVVVCPFRTRTISPGEYEPRAVSHATLTVVRGKAVLLGGVNALRQIEPLSAVYDAARRAWLVCAHRLTSRSGHAATRLGSDEVILHGGWGLGGLDPDALLTPAADHAGGDTQPKVESDTASVGLLDDVAVFNVVRNEFRSIITATAATTACDPLNSLRRYGHVMWACLGRVYLAFGSTLVVDEVTTYEGAGREPQRSYRCYERLCRPAVLALGGGGAGGSTGESWSYGQGHGEWNETAVASACPKPRKHAAGAVIRRERGGVAPLSEAYYLYGGLGDDGNVLADGLLLFTPASSVGDSCRWTQLDVNGKHEPPPLFGHTMDAALIANHECLIVVGGMSATCGSGSVHLFDTVTCFWYGVEYFRTTPPPSMVHHACCVLQQSSRRHASSVDDALGEGRDLFQLLVCGGVRKPGLTMESTSAASTGLYKITMPPLPLAVQRLKTVCVDAAAATTPKVRMTGAQLRVACDRLSSHSDVRENATEENNDGSTKDAEPRKFSTLLEQQAFCEKLSSTKQRSAEPAPPARPVPSKVMTVEALHAQLRRLYDEHRQKYLDARKPREGVSPARRLTASEQSASGTRLSRRPQSAAPAVRDVPKTVSETEWQSIMSRLHPRPPSPLSSMKQVRR